MKVKTEVLLSVYSWWMMSDECISKIKEVLEYLQGEPFPDNSPVKLYPKWSSYLDEKYNLRQYFEKRKMPDDIGIIINDAIYELGEYVYI